MESWARAEALDNVDRLTGSLNSKYQGPHLRSRTRSLAKLALDSRAIIRVYNSQEASKIRITDTFPKRGWRDQYTVVTLRGQGFDRNVQAVTVGGVLCDYIVPNDCTLLVLVPPWHMTNKPIPTNGTGFASHVKTIAELSGGVDLLDISGSLKALSSALTTPLKTGLSESETAWPCVCDPNLEGVVVPPPPLTPEEKKLLEGLNKRIVSCSEECKDGKACRTCKECKKSEGTDKCTDCKQCDACQRDCELVTDPDKKKKLLVELMTKDYQWHCWKACEDWKKELRDKALNQKRSFQAGWAQIVISSDVPVCMGENCEDEFHRDCDPDSSDPKSDPNACFAKGWIRFDKQLPKKPSGSSSKGGVTISRDKDGRITGVKTDSGFANGAELLRIVRDALKNEFGFSMQLNAEGGVKVNSGVKAAN